jgi:glutathione S-transferase
MQLFRLRCRVPAIVDHHADGFVVWESGAILLYLTDVYDKQGLYYGKTAQERASTATWLTFQLSGLGPVQGNLNVAHIYWEKFYDEKPSSGVFARFVTESHRLYKVLDDRLAAQAEKGSQWIALDRQTIADHAFYSWVRIAPYAKLDISQYTHVVQWRDALAVDEAVVASQTKHAAAV